MTRHIGVNESRVRVPLRKTAKGWQLHLQTILGVLRSETRSRDSFTPM